MLRENASATDASCLENPMAKHFPEKNSLKEVMHISPFVSSELVLLEVAKFATSEEYDSEDNLHFCEDKRSSSSSIEFELLPASPDHDAIDLD